MGQSTHRRSLRASTNLMVLILWFAASALGQENKPPQYQVDAAWPKPLPNNWLIGQIGGMAVDKHDHIWVNQRPRTLTDDEKGAVPNPPTRTEPRSICCKPAPSVMEFDAEGNLLRAWGGPEDPGKCQPPACLWPETEHGIFVDAEDHVWVSGNGPNDRMVLEFTSNGKFLRMIGGSFAGPPDSNSKTSVGKAAGIFVDREHKEVYVADGYLNSRVVKFDAQTGAFLKAWGAYGHPPVDPPSGPPPATPTAIYSQQAPNENSPTFNRPVHCVVLSRDGLLYVCDRSNNRIQVFNRDGEFQQQFVFDRATRGMGSVWSMALSPDKDQRYLFYVDGENNFFRMIDRKSGAILATYGRSGRNAGQFHWVHQIAIDSKGNVYTGEVDTGKRLQKFVPMGPRGSSWPFSSGHCRTSSTACLTTECVFEKVREQLRAHPPEKFSDTPTFLIEKFRPSQLIRHRIPVGGRRIPLGSVQQTAMHKQAADLTPSNPPCD